MADDFNLQAVISADSSQFTDAMSGLVATIQEASEALRTQLTAGAQSASEALEGIGEKSKKAAEDSENAFAEMRESAMHFAEALGIFEGIDILKEQVKQSLEFGESMQKLSVETGATTNFLQTLKFAADATGTSFEGVESAARRLTQVYSTLRAGGGSPQLLGALSSAHINVSQLANIQSGFEAISHAVQEFGVQSEIARNLVVQLLGRQGLDFLPILSQFDELKQKAAELHIVLPPEMLESLDKGNEALNILGAVIQADAEKFLSALAPSIAETANKLADMAAQAEKSGALDRWTKTIQEDMKSLPSVVDDAATAFKLFAQAIEGDAMILKGMATAVEELDKHMGGGAAFEQGLTGDNGLLKDWSPSAAALSHPMSAHGASGQIQGSMLDYLQGPQAPPSAAQPPPPPPPNHSDLTQQAGAAAKQAQEQALQSYQQQLQAYTEEQATEVALANNTAQAKVTAATNVYEKAVSLIGQTGAVSAAGYQKEVDAALRAGVEELNARREMLNQTKALAAEQITGGASEQIGGLGVQKAQLQELLAAHQITNQQELAGEQNLVEQELALEMSKFEQLSSLYADNAQKVQEYQQQEVEAQQKAQEQILELQKQSLTEQQQNTQQAANAMAQDMNQGLNLMEKYFETAGKQQQNVMREAFQSILKDFQDMIEKMIEKWLESTAIFKTFTGGEAGGSGILGGIGSVLSGTVGGSNGAGYSLTGGAIGGNPALAGLGPSSFAPGQGLTADMFTQPLSQAFHSITGELSSVFGQAFSGASGSISSVFSTIFGGLGSLFGGGGSGGFSLTSLMSFLPMLGFEEGGIVPSAAGGMVVPGGSGGTFAMLHPREMVLPAKYSEGVQRMIDRGNGDGGGTVNHTEVHYHGDMSALDSDGMDEVLSKHSDKIAGAVMDHLGRMGGRENYR